MTMILRLTLILTTVISFSCHAQTNFFEIGEVKSLGFNNYISTKQVIGISDLHGTKETPNIALQIIKVLRETEKKVTVVLEINSNYQRDIDNYLKEGDFEKLLKIEFFKFPDGRTSIAMGELLKELRQIGGVDILCFDYDLRNVMVDKRDSLMAVNLINHFSDQTMVILAGNIHLSLKEGCCGMPGFKSALYRFNVMRNLGDKLISFNTSAGGGTFWGCINEECKEWEILGDDDITEDLKSKNFITIYKEEDKVGFNGLIYFNKVSASYPLEKKKNSFLPTEVKGRN